MGTRSRHEGSRADAHSVNPGIGTRRMQFTDSMVSSESIMKNDRLSKHVQLIQKLDVECSDQMLAKLSELEAFGGPRIFENVLKHMASCRRGGLIVSDKDVVSLIEELLFLSSTIKERDLAIDVVLERFVRCLASYGRARILRSSDLEDMAKMHNMLLKNYFSAEDIVDLYVELRPYSKSQIGEFGDIEEFASVIVSLIDERVSYSHGPLSCLYFILNCVEGESLRLDSYAEIAEFGVAFNNMCSELNGMGIDQAHDSRSYGLLVDSLYSCALEGIVKTVFDVGLITRFIAEASRANDRNYNAALGLDKPAHASTGALPEHANLREEDSAVPDADYYNPWTFGWLMDAFHYMREDSWISSRSDIKVLARFIQKILEYQFTEILEDRQ